MGTEARGATNGKAKRELAWTPERYPSWRQGFTDVYARAGCPTPVPRRVTPASTGRTHPSVTLIGEPTRGQGLGPDPKPISLS